jgi:hypothetical protein
LAKGTGAWHPTAALLLNYKLPVNRLMGERWGMALSAGPVYRTTSSPVGTSSSSNWGAFAGLSFYLWERLTLTPGVHLGTFADTPLGFHSGGSFNPVVPAGITTINPVNRSTARFGIGITFHAADFKKAAALASFAANPTPPTTGQTAAAPATPVAKPPAPDPPKQAPDPVKPAATAADKAKAEQALKAAKEALDKMRAAVEDLESKEAEAIQALNTASESNKPAAQQALNEIRQALDLAKAERTKARSTAAEAQKALDALQ